MKGFIADIEDLAEDNKDFRRVLYTGKNTQPKAGECQFNDLKLIAVSPNLRHLH